MEYILIIILQTLGVLFQVGIKVKELDDKYPDDSFQSVLNEFLKSDRITLGISAVIIVLHAVTHFIIREYTMLYETYEYYPLFDFAIAFVLGFAGQKIIYKYLGKAEAALIRKADKLDNI